MYAMNFEFQIWLVMSTILAYISRELQKLLYVLQWGEQVSVKTSVMHMTCYPLNKMCICQLDPENPACIPEYPALLNQNTEKQQSVSSNKTHTSRNFLE